MFHLLGGAKHNVKLPTAHANSIRATDLIHVQPHLRSIFPFLDSGYVSENSTLEAILSMRSAPPDRDTWNK